MNLQGSLSKLLKSGSIFYQERAKLFDHNPVIREAWVLLAQDMDQQAAGLRGLSTPFWKEIQALHPDLIHEVRACLASTPRKKTDGSVSLQDALNRALSCEEPVILRVFVPVIRKLRASWTGRALDFYVIVKAHVTHLNRLVRTYCGDPVSHRRAATLLESFEKDVQRPEVVKTAKARKSSRSARSTRKSKKTLKIRSLRPSRRKPSVTRVRSVSKPVVRKVSLGRRRARR